MQVQEILTAVPMYAVTVPRPKNPNPGPRPKQGPNRPKTIQTPPKDTVMSLLDAAHTGLCAYPNEYLDGAGDETIDEIKRLRRLVAQARELLQGAQQRIGR